MPVHSPGGLPPHLMAPSGGFSPSLLPLPPGLPPPPILPPHPSLRGSSGGDSTPGASGTPTPPQPHPPQPTQPGGGSGAPTIRSGPGALPAATFTPPCRTRSGAPSEPTLPGSAGSSAPSSKAPSPSKPKQQPTPPLTSPVTSPPSSGTKPKSKPHSAKPHQTAPSASSSSSTKARGIEKGPHSAERRPDSRKSRHSSGKADPVSHPSNSKKQSSRPHGKDREAGSVSSHKKSSKEGLSSTHPKKQGSQKASETLGSKKLKISPPKDDLLKDLGIAPIGLERTNKAEKKVQKGLRSPVPGSAGKPRLGWGQGLGSILKKTPPQKTPDKERSEKKKDTASKIRTAAKNLDFKDDESSTSKTIAVGRKAAKDVESGKKKTSRIKPKEESATKADNRPERPKVAVTEKEKKKTEAQKVTGRLERKKYAEHRTSEPEAFRRAMQKQQSPEKAPRQTSDQANITKQQILEEKLDLREALTTTIDDLSADQSLKAVTDKTRLGKQKSLKHEAADFSFKKKTQGQEPSEKNEISQMLVSPTKMLDHTSVKQTSEEESHSNILDNQKELKTDVLPELLTKQKRDEGVVNKDAKHDIGQMTSKPKEIKSETLSQTTKKQKSIDKESSKPKEKDSKKLKTFGLDVTAKLAQKEGADEVCIAKIEGEDGIINETPKCDSEKLISKTENQSQISIMDEDSSGSETEFSEALLEQPRRPKKSENNLSGELNKSKTDPSYNDCSENHKAKSDPGLTTPKDKRDKPVQDKKQKTLVSLGSNREQIHSEVGTGTDQSGKMKESNKLEKTLVKKKSFESSSSSYDRDQENLPSESLKDNKASVEQEDGELKEIKTEVIEDGLILELDHPPYKPQKEKKKREKETREPTSPMEPQGRIPKKDPKEKKKRLKEAFNFSDSDDEMQKRQSVMDLDSQEIKIKKEHRVKKKCEKELPGLSDSEEELRLYQKDKKKREKQQMTPIETKEELRSHKKDKEKRKLERSSSFEKRAKKPKKADLTPDFDAVLKNKQSGPLKVLEAALPQKKQSDTDVCYRSSTFGPSTEKKKKPSDTDVCYRSSTFGFSTEKLEDGETNLSSSLQTKETSQTSQHSMLESGEIASEVGVEPERKLIEISRPIQDEKFKRKGSTNDGDSEDDKPLEILVKARKISEDRNDTEAELSEALSDRDHSLSEKAVSRKKHTRSCDTNADAEGDESGLDDLIPMLSKKKQGGEYTTDNDESQAGTDLDDSRTKMSQGDEDEEKGPMVVVRVEDLTCAHFPKLYRQRVRSGIKAVHEANRTGLRRVHGGDSQAESTKDQKDKVANVQKEQEEDTFANIPDEDLHLPSKDNILKTIQNLDNSIALLNHRLKVDYSGRQLSRQQISDMKRTYPLLEQTAGSLTFSALKLPQQRQMQGLIEENQRKAKESHLELLKLWKTKAADFPESDKENCGTGKGTTPDASEAAGPETPDGIKTKLPLTQNLGLLSCSPSSLERMASRPLYLGPTEVVGWNVDMARPHKQNRRTDIVNAIRRRKLSARRKQERLGEEYLSKMAEWRKVKRPSSDTEGESRRDEIMTRSWFSSHRKVYDSSRRGSIARAERAAGRAAGLAITDIHRSDYEQEQMIAAILYREQLEKRVKQGAATVPDMATERALFFNDSTNSRLTKDGLPVKCADVDSSEPCPDKMNCNCPLVMSIEALRENYWTDMEKCIFLDKFLQYPKNFYRISLYLANKSTRDCVKFYYDSKQTINYKLLLSHHLERRKKGLNFFCSHMIAVALSLGAIPVKDQDTQEICGFEPPPNDLRSSSLKFHPPWKPPSKIELDKAPPQLKPLLAYRLKQHKKEANFATSTQDSVKSDFPKTPRTKIKDSVLSIRVDAVLEPPSAHAASIESSPDSPWRPSSGISPRDQRQFSSGVGRPPGVRGRGRGRGRGKRGRPSLQSLASILEAEQGSMTPTSGAVSSQTISERQTPRSTKGKRGRGRFSRLTDRQERAAALQQVQQAALPPASVAVPRSMKSVLPMPEMTARVLKRPYSELPSKVSDFFPSSLKELTPAHEGKVDDPRFHIIREEEPRIEDQPKSEMDRSEDQYMPEDAQEENNLSSLLNLMPQMPRSRLDVLPGQKRALQKWSEEEKHAFLEHFSQVGKDWDELCDRIPTKTASQIKNYFQNYKQKLGLNSILDQLDKQSLAMGAASAVAQQKGTGASAELVNLEMAEQEGSFPAARDDKKWSEEEKTAFLEHFSQVGKDWDELCDRIPTKTASQIKNYFQNYKQKLGLNSILDQLDKQSMAMGAASAVAQQKGAGASAEMVNLEVAEQEGSFPAAGEDKDSEDSDSSEPKLSAFKGLPKATAHLKSRELLAANALKQVSSSQSDSDDTPKLAASKAQVVTSPNSKTSGSNSRDSPLPLPAVPRPQLQYFTDESKLFAPCAISSADATPTIKATSSDSGCSTPGSLSGGSSGGTVPPLPLNLNLNPGDLDVSAGVPPKSRPQSAAGGKPTLTVPQLKVPGLPPRRTSSPSRPPGDQPQAQALSQQSQAGQSSLQVPSVQQSAAFGQVPPMGGVQMSSSRSQSPSATQFLGLSDSSLSSLLQQQQQSAAAAATAASLQAQQAARTSAAAKQVGAKVTGPDEYTTKLRNIMAAQQQESLLRMKQQQQKGGLTALDPANFAQLRLQHQQQQSLFHQKLLQQHIQHQASQKNKAPQQPLGGPAAKRQRSGTVGKKDEVGTATAAGIAAGPGGSGAPAAVGARVSVSAGGAGNLSTASLAMAAHPQTQQQLVQILAAQKSQADLAAAVQASQRATVVQQQQQGGGATPAQGQVRATAAAVAAATGAKNGNAEQQARATLAHAQAQATHQYNILEQMARQQQLMQVHQQQQLRMKPHLFYHLHQHPLLSQQYAQQIQHAQLAAAQNQAVQAHHQQRQAAAQAKAQAQQLKAKADAAKVKVTAVGTHPALTTQLLRTAQGMHPTRVAAPEEIYDFTPHLLRQLQQPLGPHPLNAAFSASHPSLAGLDAQQIAQYQARLGAQQRQAASAAAAATRGPSPSALDTGSGLKSAETLHKSGSELTQTVKANRKSSESDLAGLQTQVATEGQQGSSRFTELRRAALQEISKDSAIKEKTKTKPK